MHQIECFDLAIGYDGKKIEGNINFNLDEGDYLCIIGENGSGKTTLMKTILGLIKPLSGNIIYSDSLSKKDIGYLPQYTEIEKNFPATVLEIVLSGFQGKKHFINFYTKAEKEIALEKMRELRIDNLKYTSFSILSGGQKQRVLLARCLCAASKVIVLDEPISNLDDITTKELYSLLYSINKKYGTSIVMISHDLVEIKKYASHILKIDTNSSFMTRDEYLKKEGENNESNYRIS